MSVESFEPIASQRRRRQDPAINVPRLVQFLLARVDEDESEIKRAARQSKAPTEPAAQQTRPTIVVQNPTRWREECAAKRRIIGIAQQMLVLRDQPAEQVVRRAAEQVLRELAAPYAQHYGYQPEWRS